MQHYKSYLRRFFLIFLLGGFLSIPAFSQSFEYKIRVDQVDMLPENPGATPSQKITINRDYFPHLDITGVAWKYPSNQTPVAFISGSAPKVTAMFRLGGCTKTIWAKADGPGSFDLPAMQLTQGSYPATPLSTAFPANVIDFYEPFELQWFISNTPNGPWMKAGKSTHPLYITHMADIPFYDGASLRFHSLIYYGCKSAKGLSNNDQIVEAIYNNTFTGRKVVRKDTPTKPNGMTYWNAGASTSCFSTEELLSHEDGRCGAWANFFQDMLAMQGIESIGSKVTWTYNEKLDQAKEALLNNEMNSFFGTEIQNIVNEPMFYPTNGAWFFVNKFNISNSVNVYGCDFEYDPATNYPELTNSTYTLLNGNILNFAPQNGVEAQGNDNPQSTFTNHAIVKYTYSNGTSKYFDPSYGLPIMNSQNDWENAAIAGFGHVGKRFRETGNPNLYHRIMWVYETNTPQLQCTFSN